MNLLNREQFFGRKKSDTIVIYGSGYSVNDLTNKNIKELSAFDSLGFNWFLKSNIPTTFYLVREQANIKYRRTSTETPGILIDSLNSDKYLKTCLIISSVDRMSPDKGPIYYDEMSHLFKGDGVVVKDKKTGCLKQIRHMDSIDVLDNGLLHWKCSLCDVLHLSAFLKYKRIIFVGIDLYDSRYFWLGRDETRHSVGRKGKMHEDQHPVSDFVLELVGAFKKKFSDVEIFRQNPKSLLRKIDIPAWP